MSESLIGFWVFRKSLADFTNWKRLNFFHYWESSFNFRNYQSLVFFISIFFRNPFLCSFLHTECWIIDTTIQKRLTIANFGFGRHADLFVGVIVWRTASLACLVDALQTIFVIIWANLGDDLSDSGGSGGCFVGCQNRKRAERQYYESIDHFFINLAIWSAERWFV